MPIEQERLIRLLNAAEDLLQGLQSAEDIVARESRLTSENLIGAEDALRNLGVMVSVEGLLRSPSETMIAIELERAHMTPSRVRENERKRRKMRERRRIGSNGQAD